MYRQLIRTITTFQGDHHISTSKHGRNGTFYKGRRTGRMGSFTKKGKFVVEEWRVRKWVVPDLSNCQLKPFVSPKAQEFRSKPLTPLDFFLEENLPLEMDHELAERCRENYHKMLKFQQTSMEERRGLY